MADTVCGSNKAANDLGVSDQQYYRQHVFFCLNQRQGNENCCANHGAKLAFDHCKMRVRQLGLADADADAPGIRVNKSGCLGRCAGGPILVIYPEGVWYSYVDLADIDEIIERHLQQGEIVERLLTPPELGT